MVDHVLIGKGHMETFVKCAFYGSLRRPMYNYKNFVSKFGSDSMRSHRIVTLKGWEMYDLGVYPGIVNSSISEEIKVELFSVLKPAYDSIHSMETGAGFYEDDIIIDNISYKIFPYAGSIVDATYVKDGDWLQYEYYNNKISKDELCSSY